MVGRSCNSYDQAVYFGRQMLLPNVGVPGQQKISAARVVIIGLGGLGCPAALYLAASGVGELCLVDGDTVGLDNLHRQILHTVESEHVEKVTSAKRELTKRAPLITVRTIAAHLTSQNAEEILKGCTCAVDCTDNAAARYLINDAAVRAGCPVVIGSGLQWEGQLLVVNRSQEVTADNGLTAERPSRSACYRCLFPDPPNVMGSGACDRHGVSGPAVGTIGCMQAVEALKVIVTPEKVSEGLLLYDALRPPFWRYVSLNATKRQSCRACAFGELAADVNALTTSCANGVTGAEVMHTIDAANFAARCLEVKEDPEGTSASITLRSPRYRVVDVRPPNHFSCWNVPGVRSYPLRNLEDDVRLNLKGRFMEKIFGNAPVLQEEKSKDIEGQCTRQEPEEVYFICRHGNDSSLAVAAIEGACSRGVLNVPFRCVNVTGGWFSVVSSNEKLRFTPIL